MTRREALRRLERNREKLRTFERATHRRLRLHGPRPGHRAQRRRHARRVRPAGAVGLFTFVRLLDFLGDVMGTRIDLATPAALRPEMRDEILAEAVRAF